MFWPYTQKEICQQCCAVALFAYFFYLMSNFPGCVDLCKSLSFSSPQVAGVPRFRFGPPEDMPQTSSSHSDLGQLASQGGTIFQLCLYYLVCSERMSLNGWLTQDGQLSCSTVGLWSTTSQAWQWRKSCVWAVVNLHGMLSGTTWLILLSRYHDIFIPFPLPLQKQLSITIYKVVQSF